MSQWFQYLWIVVLGGAAAFSVGLGTVANNAANNFGAACGSKALTYAQALVLGVLCEFCGAYFLAPRTGASIRSSYASWTQYTQFPETLMYGLMIQLAVTGIWLLLCSRLSIPASATHSTCAGVVGMAFVLSSSSINWATKSPSFPYIGGVASAMLSMIISPLLACIFSAALFMLLRSNVLRSSNAFYKAIWVMPTCVCMTITVNMLFLFYKLNLLPTKPALQITLSFAAGGLSGIVAAVVAAPWLQHRVLAVVMEGTKQGDQQDWLIELIDAQIESDRQWWKYAACKVKMLLSRLDYDIHAHGLSNPVIAAMHTNTENFDAAAEECFKGLQVIMAACLAVAHGANDVPNGMAHLATIYSIYETRTLASKSTATTWITALLAVGMALGGLFYAYNNMTTLGVRIARISPAHGFAMQMGAILVIVVTTKLKLPTSTTHVMVGAIVGVGMLEGNKCVNKALLLRMGAFWVLTWLVTAVVTAAIVAQATYAPSLPALRDVGTYQTGFVAQTLILSSTLANQTLTAQIAKLPSGRNLAPSVEVAVLGSAVQGAVDALHRMSSAACATGVSTAAAGWWNVPGPLV